MGNNTTILLCDDDILVHQTMKLYFDQEGYTTISVYNGEDALIQLDMQPISLILLDIMLPGSSGTDICRKIRSKSEVPIIFLSAKGEEIDRVVGFELGADDYITKPFFPREVIARVKTVLKRFRPQKDPRTYELGKVKVNLLSYDVSVDGSPVKMTPKEVELLGYLMQSPGEVVSREDILEHVWGTDYYGDLRAVDTIVARIRSKIRENTANVKFKSVYGVGYMIGERE